MQVVGYEPLPDPALSLAEDGDVTRLPLVAGDELAYRLGARHCAGTVQGDSHAPCDAERAPHCEVHADRRNPDAMVAGRDDEHAVYLAAFAPATFKVGVTRSGRLETRLREQGADRGAHVFTVLDGRVAREVETDVDLPERVRVGTKVAGFDRTVDEAAWADLLDGFEVHERFAFDYGLDLDRSPVPETVLAGTVLGVKGRVLVLERAGTTYAVDTRDLVGYEVEPGEPAETQSSLGSFG